MNIEIVHEFLVKDDAVSDCCRRVKCFLDKNLLLRYQEVEIDPALCVSGINDTFWPRIKTAIATNHEILAKFLAELEENGFNRTADFIDMEQGFVSKTLHTVVHLLDGFIGIDSAFYSLVDDSHWLDRKRKERIEKNPGKYHLVRAKGRCHGISSDFTGLLRHFDL